jgi:branched-chain amino acid transport system substrate-binding protein
MKRILISAAVAASLVAAGSAHAAKPDLKIGHVYGISGALEKYARTLKEGLEMGFEYMTEGKNAIQGRKIVMVEKDTQLRADLGRTLVAEAMGDDQVDMVLGPLSSGVVLAALPVAEEYKKVLIAEGASNDITGKDWNRYVFRVARNSDHDAVANALAVAGKNTYFGGIAQDYTFGHDGLSAFADAVGPVGGEMVVKEFVPMGTRDFTANIQRLFDELKNKSGKKYIFPFWAGGGSPVGAIADADPGRFGIELILGGNILDVLKGYKRYAGSKGGTYYYYDLPQNDVNDFLVIENYKRYGLPPDFFTAQGFAEAQFIYAAVTKTKGDTDSEALIKAMRGLKFMTPKGEVEIRAQDHQAMQAMYAVEYVDNPEYEWAENVLIREISKEEQDIPIRCLPKCDMKGKTW